MPCFILKKGGLKDWGENLCCCSPINFKKTGSLLGLFLTLYLFQIHTWSWHHHIWTFYTFFMHQSQSRAKVWEMVATLPWYSYTTCQGHLQARQGGFGQLQTGQPKINSGANPSWKQCPGTWPTRGWLRTSIIDLIRPASESAIMRHLSYWMRWTQQRHLLIFESDP